LVSNLSNKCDPCTIGDGERIRHRPSPLFVKGTTQT
jgi:hypothetical protein